ncbi:MAG TPA: hypothetical protein VMM36_09575 [Opitutaceae bacterium]|nr:hypothetical protein [Opitutaceae bacterium]
MSTPQNNARRLLEALERLVGEEALLVRAGDFDALAATQERIGEVLAVLGSLAAGSVAYGQIAPLLERRDETRHEIGRRAIVVRGELDRIQGGRRRLRELGPAYAGTAVTRSRFQSEA